MAIFPNVCLWRRSYDQNWEVLALKNCYSIEPPSYASAAYVVVSYDPRFFSTVRFVKIRATCENFLGKWFTAPHLPLAKNFPYAYAKEKYKKPRFQYIISTTKVTLVNLFALLYILQDIYRSSFSDESSRNNRAIS